MDALKLLKQDHEKVEDLFDEVEGLSERARKRRVALVRQICDELDVHAAIEEKVFYPSVRQADEDVGDLVLESFEEHALVKQLVSELRSMDESDERYDAKCSVLEDLVLHHVEEEQDELFPKVRKAMDKQELDELGERLQEMKMRLQRGEEKISSERPRARRRAGNGAMQPMR